VYSTLAAEEIELPLTHPSNVLASSDRDDLEARLRSRYSSSLRYPFNKYASSLKRIIEKVLGHGQDK
jgi:hypothetical protein